VVPAAGPGENGPCVTEIPAPPSGWILIPGPVRVRQRRLQDMERLTSRRDVRHTVTADRNHVIVGGDEAPFPPMVLGAEEFEPCTRHSNPLSLTVLVREVAPMLADDVLTKPTTGPTTDEHLCDADNPALAAPVITTSERFGVSGVSQTRIR
jgi:hypothetical protein